MEIDFPHDRFLRKQDMLERHRPSSGVSPPYEVFAILVRILQQILPPDAFSYIFSREIREIIAATTIQRWYRKRLAETCVCDYMDHIFYDICGRRYYLEDDEDYMFCSNRCYFHRCRWTPQTFEVNKIWCIDCDHFHCKNCGQRCRCDDNGGESGIPNMNIDGDLIYRQEDNPYAFTYQEYDIW